MIDGYVLLNYLTEYIVAGIHPHFIKCNTAYTLMCHKLL